MWPVDRLASSDASFTRCASPPDSVGGRLAEPHVAEADVDQRLHVPGDGRLVGEELERLLARQVEHVGDRLALEVDVERVAVVAGALAHLARHVDVGQEVHLDLDRAVARARLAAAALDVEREPAGLVAADLGLLGLREQLADVVEHAGVGGRVRPRRAADGRLVDVDDLVELLDARRPSCAGRAGSSSRRLLHQRAQQDVVDRRGLARARHAGDRDEAARAGCRRRCSARLCSRAPLIEIHSSPGSRRSSGMGIVLRPDRYCPVIDFVALEQARRPCPSTRRAPPCSPAPGPMSTTWSARLDRVLVVLDDEHGVAEVAQAVQRLDEAVVVALVQADGRLVEHVEHADEARADLRGQADALRLAARRASPAERSRVR